MLLLTDMIESILELAPNGSLQERIYSPLQLCNEVGPSFIQELLQVPYEFNGKHHVVFI